MLMTIFTKNQVIVKQVMNNNWMLVEETEEGDFDVSCFYTFLVVFAPYLLFCFF